MIYRGVKSGFFKKEVVHLNYTKRVVFLALVDLMTVLFAIIFAFFLRFDARVPSEYILSIGYAFILITVPMLFFIKRYKLYRRVWQYASIGELVSIIKVSTYSLAIASLFYLAMDRQLQIIQFNIPLSIFLMTWINLIVFVGGSRFLWRMIGIGE